MPYVPYTNLYSDWNKYPAWYIPVSFFLVLFAYDTTFYWGHRVLHRYNWFYKYMHIIHHASKQPNPFTSFSFNPLEICFNYFIFLLVAMAIPMHFEVLKAFFTFNMLFSIYHHTGYEVVPRKVNVWLNRYVGLVTPSYHNIHHSKYKYHFSFVFTYWDKICGTYYPDWQKDNIYVFEGLWKKKPKKK
jgi:lathosterol oxidase